MKEHQADPNSVKPTMKIEGYGLFKMGRRRFHSSIRVKGGSNTLGASYRDKPARQKAK
jgi:hypothetical protein